jgi:hypothetical protein
VGNIKTDDFDIFQVCKVTDDKIIPNHYDVVIRCKSLQLVYFGGINLKEYELSNDECKINLIRNDILHVNWGYVRNSYGFFGSLEVKIIDPAHFMDSIKPLDACSINVLKERLTQDLYILLSQILVDKHLHQDEILQNRSLLEEEIKLKILINYYQQYGIEVSSFLIHDTKEKTQKFNQNNPSSEDLLW